MKLLIVESDQKTRTELVTLTKQWGYDVIAVDAWKTTLDILEQVNGPQLIIVGFDVSELARVEVCQKIKLIKPGNLSYILLLSSPINVDDIAAGVLAGANDYISSPVDSTELQIRLDVAQGVIGLNQTAINIKGPQFTPKHEQLHAGDAGLQCQLEQCRLMLDHVGAYVYTKDIQGRYTYANDKVCELFACSASEIIGRDDSQFFSLNESSELRANDLFVMQNNKVVEAEECNIVAETGATRYYATVKKPLLDNNGIVVGLLGVSTDITESKEDEGKLKELLRKAAQQTRVLDDKRELYDIVFKNTNSGVLILEIESFRFTSCNEQAAAMLGYGSKADILNTHPQELSPDFQLGGVRSDEKAKAMCAIALKNGAHTFEWQHLTKNNGSIWIEVTVTPVVIKGEQVLHVVWKDINERKAAEASLALSARVFHEVNEAIVITNPDRSIIDANPAFCELVGYSHNELKGLVGRALHSKKHSDAFFDNVWECVGDNGFWRGEIDVKSKSKGTKTCQLTVSSVLNDDGRVVNYLGMYIDITDRKEQQKKLTLLAHYDQLTGLPNRSLFVDRFKQAVAHSKRYKNPLAVCFLDLDSFKPINDKFGHDVGDKLLIQVAERISTTLRDEDTVSRQGGDEFALLLSAFESPQQCGQIVHRMLQSLAQPYLIDGQPHQITASCGIALYPDNSDELDTLMRQADQAMYSSKRAGKNKLSFFSG